MDRRESIKRVLRGEASERLPRALFGAGLWSFRQAGLRIENIARDPLLFADTLADFFTDLDTDIVFAGSGLNSFPAEAIGGHPAFRESQAPLLSFPVIQSAKDAQYFEKVDISDSPYTLALIEMITRMRQRMPDRFLCATSWGPFTWSFIFSDWNIVREKAQTDRSFIREVCELGLRLSQAFLDPLIARGAIDGISIPEGAVTLIPSDLYREVVLPCERKLFEHVRSQGIACFLHQCGNIGAQIPIYPETGADCISIDAGVSIGEVYDLYRDRLVTAGNVDVVNTIFGGDPAAVCKAVNKCVSQISDPFRKYILMPSCDLPIDTPLRNAKEFLSCADRFSR